MTLTYSDQIGRNTSKIIPRLISIVLSVCRDHIGLERELMGKVARMKLHYFGHVTRGSAENLALTVLEGSIDGLRHQGRPKRQWIDDIEEWSGCSYIQLKEMSQDREQWRRKTIDLLSPTVIDDGRLVNE